MTQLNLSTVQQPNLELRQRMMTTANMQQALRLLQLPIQEMDLYLEEQMLANPVLELDKDDESSNSNDQEKDDSIKEESFNEELVISDKDFDILKRLDEDWQDFFAQSEAPTIQRSSEDEKLKAFLDSSVCAEISLYDHLLQQSHDTFEDAQELAMAEILIGYIDAGGFLTTPLSEIALLHHFEESELYNILKELQTFEPFGIGASTIQESLLIQLSCQKKEGSLAYEIILNHYDELLSNQIPAIQKKIGCSFEEIKQGIENEISKLTLHPGASYSAQKSSYIVPEVSIRQEGDQLVVDTNRDHLQGLRFNRHYLKMLDDPETTNEAKNYIRQHILSAKWLMRNLQQRYSTIERIADFLAKNQREFFTNPQGKLRPLIMKTLAEELNVHESTIARTVANKYINTPRGLLPLRSFFTAGYVSEQGEDLSAQTVRDAIVEIIENEDKKQPYSDEKISGLLKEKDINCARRTIAKYRSALLLGNALQRKKY